jgi:hypothetical protein
MLKLFRCELNEARALGLRFTIKGTVVIGSRKRIGGLQEVVNVGASWGKDGCVSRVGQRSGITIVRGRNGEKRMITRDGGWWYELQGKKEIVIRGSNLLGDKIIAKI